MKLATQDHPVFGEKFEDKLVKIQSLGFEGLELDGKILIDQFKEIKQAVQETGIPITSTCGGYRGWIGDFEKKNREKAVADISEILKYTSEIGGRGIVVPAAWGMFSRRLPPLTPPRSEEEDKEALLHSLEALDKVASETETCVLLEPLNRYEDHMINRLADAAELINDGGFSSVKIMADFFHMNIEETGLETSILESADLIGHVHLADNSRFQPGTGHLDFQKGFRALKEIGFTGYMALECRMIGEPEQAYKDSIAYLKSQM